MQDHAIWINEIRSIQCTLVLLTLSRAYYYEVEAEDVSRLLRRCYNLLQQYRQPHKTSRRDLADHTRRGLHA